MCVPWSRPSSQTQAVPACWPTWHFCSSVWVPSPNPHPPTCCYSIVLQLSKWQHHSPNHESPGIWLQNMSRFIHFLPLYATTRICCPKDHHPLPRTLQQPTSQLSFNHSASLLITLQSLPDPTRAELQLLNKTSRTYLLGSWSLLHGMFSHFSL